MMLMVSIVGTVILLLVAVTFREKPNRPLTGSIIQTEVPIAMSFLDQLKCLKSKYYWLATISSSLTISFYYTFSTVIG